MKNESSIACPMQEAQNVNSLTVAEVVQTVITALKSGDNSDKFLKIFEDGDFAGYKDSEEVELGLCKMIAAEVLKLRRDDSADIIDMVFRKSKICRMAWLEEEYRDPIIQKAIAATKIRKQPPFIEAKKVSSGKVVEMVSTSLLRSYIQQTLPYKIVRDEESQRIAIFLYQDGVYSEIDAYIMKAIIREYIEEYDERMVTARILDDTYKLILAEKVYIPLSSFNADENIINFQNGILRLDTMKLVPHSPDYLSTVQIPCDWTDKPCETPVFNQYMETLSDGREDVKHFLMQYIGMCLSNVYGYRLKRAVVLVGNGNTGKSQLKLLIERILGNKNFFSIDLKTLEARFGTSYIVNKRLAGCADMGFVSLAELRVFKQVTGGDNIQAEGKYDKSFSFVYKGLLMYCTNALPKFSGDDGPWVYERFCLIDCPNEIPKEKRDRCLLDKMYAERQGIIQKALIALKELVDDDFDIQEPACTIALRQRYMKLNNPVAAFIEECMVPYVKTLNSKQDLKRELYYIFTRWCKANNNGYILSNKEFTEKVAKYFGKDEDEVFKRTADGIVLDGYTLGDNANIYR